MATTTNEQAVTKVITGLVRFSYLHVWEASAVKPGQEAKFSASLIIPKDDKKTLAKIKAAVEAATELGKTSKFGGKIPANLKKPLRDGDTERPDDEVYANAYFLNANAKTQPGIVDSKANPIINRDEMYSGCYGIASITFYPYDNNGSKGIACGLNHLMKKKDGDSLGGRTSADQDFAEVLENEEDDLM